MATLPNRRVLDVGSGTGFYLKRWRELGATEIAASDISAVAVERLGRDYPRQRFALGGETRPAQWGGFGAVSAMEVLFHILADDAYERAFATLFDLLAPGGVLVFSENFLHAGELRVPHQRSRTLAQVEATVFAAGFEILRRRPQFWLMNAPHDSQGRLHRLWWRGLAGVAARSDAAGAALGALLYGPELAAVARLREGPPPRS